MRGVRLYDLTHVSEWQHLGDDGVEISFCRPLALVVGETARSPAQLNIDYQKTDSCSSGTSPDSAWSREGVSPTGTGSRQVTEPKLARMFKGGRH